MFSNNGKISNHQAVRLLIMDIFTGACLFLPMALSRLAGNGGLLAFILGLVLTFLDGALISRCLVRFSSHYIPSLGDGWAAKGLRLLYGARCFATYIFLMGMFSSVLNETFLYTMPKVLIIVGMTLVLIYGCVKGIEVRARLSEIFFYMILVPIVLIGLFSLPEADWSRLLVLSDITGEGLLQGILVTWVLMAPVEWMLYIAPENPDGRPLRIFAWAIGIGGSLVALIYILCVTVLSTQGMAAERWPTVVLMQIVRIPGGFLSRQDGLMLSFWIFAMFISLSGALSHTSNLWGTGLMRAKRWKIWLFAVIGSVLAFYFGMDKQFMNIYFWVMIISGIVLLWIVPLIISVWGNKKRKPKIIASFLVASLLCGSLTGCENYIELENRAFVMALGVDIGKVKEYSLTYTFPDLAEITGKSSGDKILPITLEAESLKEGEKTYDRMSDKSLDYGQVKIMILGEALLSNREALDKFLEEIRNKPEFVRTVLVCKSEMAITEVLALDEEVDGSIGIYMEDMFKNNNAEFILNDFMLKPESGRLPEVLIRDKKLFLVESNGQTN